MSDPSNYSTPLRQRPPRSMKKLSTRSATQAGRIEKSTSNPSSPRPPQLRRRAPLPVRSIPALRTAYQSSLEHATSARRDPLIPPDVDADLPRPVSWHPGGQRVLPSNAYTHFRHLTHSSPLSASSLQHDDPAGTALARADSYLPFGWSGSDQSDNAVSTPFPVPVGSSFGEASDIRQSGSYMLDEHSRHFDAPSAPLNGMYRLQNFQHSFYSYPQNQHPLDYPFMVPDLEPDSNLITLPTASNPIPVPQEKPAVPDNSVLVGMGLYDEPENTSSWDPQSAQYQSLLLGGGGKGWKLEETFHPLSEDIEAERGSSVGDEEFRSPSLDLDFEDFQPVMSDEVGPLDFESPYDPADGSLLLPWINHEVYPDSVTGAEFYTGMPTYTGYPMM